MGSAIETYPVKEVLKEALKTSKLDEYSEPNYYSASNNKAVVISFTSLESVIKLFTIISGYRNGG
jgi:hypothetical protein